MKKIIALLLSILMVCSLAACASKQDTAAASETASTETAASSGEEKTLTMATNVAFPPYEFYENEKPAGIDVEIATAICEKLGYKLDIMDIEFGAILGAVSSGKADFTMAGLTVTDERKQSVDFSTSYATGIQSIVVKEDSPITSVDDLYADGADYQIGVQQDTTGDIYCSDDFGDDHVQRFNKGADAVAALVSGKLDCVVIDNEPAKSFVAANDGLKVLDTAYAVEDYAAAFAKGSELTELAKRKGLLNLGCNPLLNARIDQGARLACGGYRLTKNGLDKGLFMEPTLLADVTNDMKVAQEEIFGPVLVAIKFKDEEDVLRMANDSKYGLSGAVFTRDINRAFRIARGVETGRMWINAYGDISTYAAIFGGYKQSGIGREGHWRAFDHYTQMKSIVVNLAE